MKDLVNRWTVNISKAPGKTLNQGSTAIFGSGLDFQLIFKIVNGGFQKDLHVADAWLPSTAFKHFWEGSPTLQKKPIPKINIPLNFFVFFLILNLQLKMEDRQIF